MYFVLSFKVLIRLTSGKLLSYIPQRPKTTSKTRETKQILFNILYIEYLIAFLTFDSILRNVCFTKCIPVCMSLCLTTALDRKPLNQFPPNLQQTYQFSQIFLV